MKHNLTSRQVRRRIRAIMTQCTISQWDQGLGWYANAHAYCIGLSMDTGYSLECTIGCLAALSPLCEWEHNKAMTLHLLQHGDCPKSYKGFKYNVTKAQTILNGGAPNDVLGGRKVLAFYHNVLEPFRSDAVTVDTHIAGLALGAQTLERRQQWFVFDGRGNAIIQSAFRSLAPSYGLRPCELQAITWLIYKSMKESTSCKV